MTMRLKNKIIIITGSCTGIGKAIATRCVDEGAKVIVHGLENDLGEEVVGILGTGNATLHVEDITNDGAPQRLVQKALDTFGQLDALVNNAAWITSSNINTTEPDYFKKVLDINTIAPLNLIRAALPHLIKTKGSVLNIGSVNAYCGESNLLAYSISKGALMTMTRNLGDTLFREHGVRVNQINPGWVLTETEAIRKRNQGMPADWYKSIPKMYAPSGRILAPSEIASAALYFLADESGPVSGQVMDVEQHPFIGRNPPKNIAS